MKLEPLRLANFPFFAYLCRQRGWEDYQAQAVLDHFCPVVLSAPLGVVENNLIAMVGGWVCPGPCKGSRGGQYHQLNTRYIQEDRNWAFLCPECLKSTLEYYQDLWDEYYRDCY